MGEFLNAHKWLLDTPAEIRNEAIRDLRKAQKSNLAKARCESERRTESLIARATTSAAALGHAYAMRDRRSSERASVPSKRRLRVPSQQRRPPQVLD